MEEVPGTPESELFCSCQMASLSCFFSFLFFNSLFLWYSNHHKKTEAKTL